MADEVDTTQEVDETQESATDDALSPEDAKKLIKELRKEAASRRIKGKESEEKAAKWEEYVQSQKTELEKLQEENKLLRDTAEADKVEKLRNRIIAEFKLDPSDAEFLTGSEKEMKALAAKLAEKAGQGQTTTTDFYAGQRGGNVSPKADNLNDWFTQQWFAVEGKK